MAKVSLIVSQMYCIELIDKRKGHCTCHPILKAAIHRDFLSGVFHVCVCVFVCVALKN